MNGMPPKINTTGNTVIDTETAQLAVHLRDAGMTERAAITEAQRIRDTFITAVMHPVARLAQGALKTAYGCYCTGREGCPNPAACGTPQGCLCGA